MSKIAFVLSRGGSLGAIQVGMLQALGEEGSRPDLLVGTSVGAVNAAFMAGRPDGAQELAHVWSGLRRQDIFPLNAWASACGLLGRTKHIIPNTNLRSVLERHIPYERLEDASVPLHVIATELKTGQATVLSSGPAVPALLASTAIPGVFPPVTIGRRELVDGGVANHAPIAVAIELGATQVFVLPVGYPWCRSEPSNALGMALHALARFVEQRLEIEVATHGSKADIRVLPAVDAPPVSPADFSRSSELIRRAYRTTRRYLAAPSDKQVPAQTLTLAAASIRAA